MLFVVLFAATLAVFRLWIAELHVIAYGPCGAIDATFKETREFETLFWWFMAPITIVVWIETYLISQLRRVANGPNRDRISSLNSGTVSFHSR